MAMSHLIRVRVGVVGRPGFRRMSRVRRKRGASLIEILIGMLIIVVASMGTLTYYALGNVGRQGNRRAALEQARQRLEQLLEVNVDTIKPAIDPSQPPNNQPVRWVSCSASSCGSALASNPNDTVTVDDLPNQPLVSTVQWKDDPAAGTPTPDVLELGVKVWFVPGSTDDDNVHRVHLRTLRIP